MEGVMQWQEHHGPKMKAKWPPGHYLSGIHRSFSKSDGLTWHFLFSQNPLAKIMLTEGCDSVQSPKPCLLPAQRSSLIPLICKPMFLSLRALSHLSELYSVSRNSPKPLLPTYTRCQPNLSTQTVPLYEDQVFLYLQRPGFPWKCPKSLHNKR